MRAICARLMGATGFPTKRHAAADSQEQVALFQCALDFFVGYIRPNMGLLGHFGPNIPREQVMCALKVRDLHLIFEPRVAGPNNFLAKRGRTVCADLTFPWWPLGPRMARRASPAASRA